MTHVASLRKNRLFDPIFRMFYPDPAYVCSPRAGGSSPFLAPGKGGSPLSTPSRPAAHDVGASGFRPATDLPPLAAAIHRQPNWKMPTGAPSRRAVPLFQYGTKPGDPYGKINPFILARRRRTVDHSLAARGAQPQWLQACLPDGHKPH